MGDGRGFHASCSRVAEGRRPTFAHFRQRRRLRPSRHILEGSKHRREYPDLVAELELKWGPEAFQAFPQGIGTAPHRKGAHIHVACEDEALIRRRWSLLPHRIAVTAADARGHREAGIGRMTDRAAALGGRQARLAGWGCRGASATASQWPQERRPHRLPDAENDPASFVRSDARNGPSRTER